MQSMQRAVLTLAAVAAVWFGISMVYQDNGKKIRTQWERLQIERFLEEICRTQECSYETLCLYYAALSYRNEWMELRLEEYRKEWDQNGRVYYYLITWEEILDTVLAEGYYSFEEDSILQLQFIRSNGATGNQGQYYDIVDGRKGT